MIYIENTKTLGFDTAIRAMRNPLNSWAKSDSGYDEILGEYIIGDADKALMKKLVAAGTDHSKFMRMITVTCDITAPLYWWKEFDTYRMGVEKNSCSTMHTLHKRDIVPEDISMERVCERYKPAMDGLIEAINDARRQYEETGDTDFWESMVQMLPTSYNQRRTVMMSYQAIRSMYHARKHHKLREWHVFCRWSETLPQADLITGGNCDEA